MPEALTYAVPESMAGVVSPGCRVRVRLRGAPRVGLVLELTSEPGCPPERVQPIAEVLDARPLLPDHVLALLRFAADYYFAAPGLVARAALPPEGADAAAAPRGARRGGPGRPRQAPTRPSGACSSGSSRRAGSSCRGSLPRGGVGPSCRRCCAACRPGGRSRSWSGGRRATASPRSPRSPWPRSTPTRGAADREGPGPGARRGLASKSAGCPALEGELLAACGCATGVVTELVGKGLVRRFQQARATPAALGAGAAAAARHALRRPDRGARPRSPGRCSRGVPRRSCCWGSPARGRPRSTCGRPGRGRGGPPGAGPGPGDRPDPGAGRPARAAASATAWRCSTPRWPRGSASRPGSGPARARWTWWRRALGAVGAARPARPGRRGRGAGRLLQAGRGAALQRPRPGPGGRAAAGHPGGAGLGHALPRGARAGRAAACRAAAPARAGRRAGSCRRSSWSTCAASRRSRASTASACCPGALRRCSPRTLDRGEQAILLVNRRGWAPVLLCRECGAPGDAAGAARSR